MKDDCRLLIKTAVFIQHLVLKEILLHGFYNTWKTFSLLYKPSTVNPLCRDAAYDSCGESCAPHADQHLPGKLANRTGCWLSFRPCYKKSRFSCQWNQPFEEDFSYHLGWLSVTVFLFEVRRHSPTLQFHVELRFDHQTAADWS